jgi:succinyl-diaminopimelate desuccinylase
LSNPDPIALTQALIRCPSVTPEDGGALGALEAVLRPLGFVCHRLPFSEAGTPDVDNLYARLGTGAPHFCFAGHTDVVPVGQGWSVDPFRAEIIDGQLYGRGASDMKGAIAAFVCAVARLLEKGGPPEGSISLLITGDEEGPSINGTRKVLDWMKAKGEKLDACLVGEPTNPTRLGEMIKIGRRGSLNGKLTVFGVQGHSAYPHLADNPIPRLLAMLNALTAEPLDEGSSHFQPSTFVITTVDVGNPATNVIPAQARAGFNVRFNDLHDSKALEKRFRDQLDRIGGDYSLEISVSGESFLTPPGSFSDMLVASIEGVTGIRPELSTTGGTSDARFIKDHCQVAEFGLVGQTMHKADERAALADLEALTGIYGAVLSRFFQRS